MKIFLITLVTLVLNQNVFATGASGDDPGLSTSSGSPDVVVAPGFVGSADQQPVCTLCAQNKSNAPIDGARMNATVINTAAGAAAATRQQSTETNK